MKTPKTRREREIWEACDALWHVLQQDKEPITALTGERLRNKLIELGYKRGNQNQIYQYRQTWKQSRGIEELDETPDRQSILNERVSQIVAYVMKECQADADESIVLLQKTQEEKLCLVKEEQKATERSLHKLNERVEQLTDENRKLEVTCKNNTEAMHEQSRQLAVAEEQQKVLTKALHAERENYHKQLTALSVAYETNKHQFEERLKAEEKERQHEVDTLKIQYEDYRHKSIVDLDTVNTSRKKIENQLHTAQREIDKNKQQADQHERRANRLETKLSQASEKNKTRKETQTKKQTELMSELHARENALARAEGEATVIMQQLEYFQQQCQALQQAVVTHKTDIGRLERELVQTKKKRRVEIGQ